MFSWNEQGRSAAEAIDKLKEEVSNRQGYHHGFFDRKVETSWLLDYLSAPPEGVLAVVGPKSSGKSALLQEVARLWATESVLLVSRPIIYVDCRVTNFGVIEDAGLAMKEALSGFLDKVERIAESVTVTLPGRVFGIPGPAASIRVGDALQAFRGKLYSASTVREMVNMFRDYLASNYQARPTLVLDEAQTMEEWPEAEFKRFIGVFTALTKQHRAHLVVCSSDDLFIDWLGKSFESGAWEAFAIGPFPEDEARGFFEYMLSDVPHRVANNLEDEELVEAARPEAQVPTLLDDCWEKVFNLCGGSPLHLRTLALLLKKKGGITNSSAVESSLENVYDKAMHVYSLGLYPTEISAWTGDLYSSVVTLIVGGGGCVGFEKIVETLFSDNVIEARKVIHAMMAANVLHIRYVSTELKYIDMPSLSKPRHRYQVMAVSPPHLAAMRAVVKNSIHYCQLCAYEFDTKVMKKS